MRPYQRLALSIVALVLVACATPINERPMYGGREKTPAMREADARFIQDCIADGTNREAASREVSQLGWQYFFRNDFSTAMKRFNQDWLLDPNNPEAYWGFGLIRKKEGDYEAG